MQGVSDLLELKADALTSLPCTAVDSRAQVSVHLFAREVFWHERQKKMVPVWTGTLWISSIKRVTTAEETRGFSCDSKEGL